MDWAGPYDAVRAELEDMYEGSKVRDNMSNPNKNKHVRNGSLYTVYNFTLPLKTLVVVSTRKNTGSIQQRRGVESKSMHTNI